MNNFDLLKQHIGSKTKKITLNDKRNSFSSCVEFFKNKSKNGVEANNNVKPIVKKVVLPEKEHDVFLDMLGYSMNKTYVNPKIFNNTNPHTYSNKTKQPEPEYLQDIVIEM